MTLVSDIGTLLSGIAWIGTVALATCLTPTAIAQGPMPVQVVRPGLNQTVRSERFGNAMVMSGDTLLVGACLVRVGDNFDQGAVYVFRRNGIGWGLEATLTPNDGTGSELFGISIALSGDTAVIGAVFGNHGALSDLGTAYVFTRQGTTWTQSAKLVAPDARPSDQFGSAVAISGNTIFVGAPMVDVGGSLDQGVVYEFTGAGDQWQPQAILHHPSGSPGDRFGSTIAVDEDTVAIGAPRDDHGCGGADHGTAHVFVRFSNTWAHQALLRPRCFSNAAEFGSSLALRGNMLVVGAPRDGLTMNTFGSCTVFERSESQWFEQARLTAPPGIGASGFGMSLALSNTENRLLVGSAYDTVGGANGLPGQYRFEPSLSASSRSLL